MNVVVLSDHDFQGGAAVATCRIEVSIDWSNLVCRRDEAYSNTQRVVFFPDSRITPITELWYDETASKRRLLRLPRKLLPSYFPQPNTPAFAARRLRDVLDQLKPDIVSVHNLHAASPWGWGPHLIDVCLDFAPVVWTLHDMWSFTGRCAYSYDCEKFTTGCDASCPTPHEEPKLEPENIQAAWEERRAIYGRRADGMVIVTPSRWLAEQARRGMFARHRIVVIPYGVEDFFSLSMLLDNSRFHAQTSQLLNNGSFYREFSGFPRDSWDLRSFYPFPREDARRQLGINPAGPVLLLAAFDLTERRKGAEILPKLWQYIEHRPLTILTMGRGAIPIDDPLIEVHPLGYLDDDGKKALAYSAADALLHPAPVDNFPNVVLEALACGTPTIAMPVGGVPEIVRPGVSGWLAEAATPEALGQAVNRALRDISLGKDLRESCRSLAEKEYSLELQGRRYLELFQELRKRR
jgi:glycosyltransferase involved in cell wall biosynthesis